MKTIVVDTSVWVDFFGPTRNPETEWLEHGIGRELIAMTDLILCEVLQGIREERQYEDIKLQLLEFEIFPTGGLEMAVAAAENHRILRTSRLLKKSEIL
jgi:predicted nucleic acid-binding protein